MKLISLLGAHRLLKFTRFLSSNQGFSSVMCEPRKINTLVFFDTETTGLPGQEWGRTRITELSLCAARVCDLQQLNQGFPRVINKINLCLNPHKPIDNKASEITGLNNELLEYYGGFDESVFRIMEDFLQRLPQPVCLLAHNGNKFDFPILHAELKHINKNFSDEVLCADSLAGFRQLYGVNNTRRNLFTPKVEIGSSLGARQSQGLCMEVDGITPLEKKNNGTTPHPLPSTATIDVQRAPAAAHAFCHPVSGLSSQAPSASTNSGFSCAPSDEWDEDFIKLADQIELEYRTPPKQRIPTGICPPTPRKQPFRQKFSEITPFKPQQTLSMQQINETTPQRSIVPKEESIFSNKPKNFTLSTIYAHVTQCPVPPNLHSAEADCMALMQCAAHLSPHFTDWVQINAVPFNQLKK